MIASSLCSGCHGAALDGLGEPAGDIMSDATLLDRWGYIPAARGRLRE